MGSTSDEKRDDNYVDCFTKIEYVEQMPNCPPIHCQSAPGVVLSKMAGNRPTAVFIERLSSNNKVFSKNYHCKKL